LVGPMNVWYLKLVNEHTGKAYYFLLMPMTDIIDDD